MAGLPVLGSSSTRLSTPYTLRMSSGVSTCPGVPDGTYRFYGPDGDFLLLGRCEAGTGRTVKSFFGGN